MLLQNKVFDSSEHKNIKYKAEINILVVSNLKLGTKNRSWFFRNQLLSQKVSAQKLQEEAELGYYDLETTTIITYHIPYHKFIPQELIRERKIQFQ